MLRRLLRDRAGRVSLGGALLVGLGLSASRLFGVHGAESALALGLVLPLLVAPLGARLAREARGAEAPVAAAELLGDALVASLWVAAVPLGVLALNQLRVRQCDPWGGLAFVLLGPVAGACLAALAGVFVGACVRRPRLAAGLAALVPLLSIGEELLALYRTPAIFAFDPFVGYFPGSLYDEDVSIPSAYLSYRALSVAAAVALGALFVALWDPSTARLRPSALRDHPRALLLAVAGLTVAAVGGWYGDALGHRASAPSIAIALGTTLEGDRCVVHVPRELDRITAERMRDDCDFRVARAEAALGLRQREPVRAFFYRTVEEKRRAMGAGHTFIAKPWRNEVHLQLAEWPHPVLFHEIVHVVAGNAAPGPLHVAGMLGGLLPNVGLIEGTAVAVAWEGRDGLTPHEWSRTMRALGLLPPLEELLGVGFLGHAAGRAYTAAGSFVRFLLDAEGPDAVRRVYEAGTVDGVLGVSAAELEARWLAFLDAEPAPPGAVALARVRFARPSLFSQVCPHAVAHLQAALAGNVGAGDPERVLATCDALLAIDAADLGTRAVRVGALARVGRMPEAERELEDLRETYRAPAPLVVRARAALADALWLGGETGRALAIYRELLAEPQTDDEARQLEVKALGLEAGGALAELVRDLLVRGDGPATTPAIALHLGARIEAERSDGLGPYLVGRQLSGQRRYDLAAPLFQSAATRGLPTARLAAENARLLGQALVGSGALDAAEAFYRTATVEPLEADDWLARIAFQRRRAATAR